MLIAAFLSAAAFQVTYRIGKEQIKIWDESSSAKNAVEMLASKHYFVVHTDGSPNRNDVKPPFQLWLKVISYKIFGINEFAVRFPTIVAALITMIIFVIFFVKLVKDYLLVMVVLAAIAITPGYIGYHVARHGDPDTLLMLFVTSYFLITFVLLEKYPGERNRYLSLLGLSVILAVYTKSIAGLAPLAGIAVYFLTQKKGYDLLKDYRFHLTWFSVIFVIALYYVLREIFDPGYIKAVYQLEIKTVSEYHGIPKHPEFDFYYLYLRFKAFYPMAIVLFLAFIPLIWSKNKVLRRLLLYSIMSAVIFVLGQSLAVMKNEWYITPVYPFLWVWFGITIVETYRIINRYLFYRWVKIVWTVSVILYLSHHFRIHYTEIFKKNQIITIKGKVFMPERAGFLLREVKKKYPDIRNIAVISRQPLRQVQFYTMKYECTDSSKFTFSEQVDTTMSRQYLLSAEKDFLSQVDSLFHYRIMYKNPNGFVVKTIDRK